MTQEELQALCVEWQKRLRLQDWDVVISFAQTHELGVEPLADVITTRELKFAKIRVLREEDWPKDALRPIEIDHLLAHELVHLHFEPFMADKSDPQHMAQEQAIDLLARALAGLKREASPLQLSDPVVEEPEGGASANAREVGSIPT